MWRRLPKYRMAPKLAPPTANADKDGSFYRPPLAELQGRPRPNVPLAARNKSARKLVDAIEAKRSASMSDQVKTNPLCYVSAIIERPPVIMRSMKSWELDMTVAQARIDAEMDASIPPSIIKPSYEENPEWAVNMFQQVFRDKAKPLMPLVSVPKATEAAPKVAQGTGAAGSGEELSKKQKKKVAAKDAKKGSADAASVAGTTEQAAKPVESETSQATTGAIGGADGWMKSFADMGIEFAEEKVEEQSMTKMHVELKQKEDDQQAFFQPAPRTTEADAKNDTRSLDRKLAEKLYLVVKRNGKWGFPSVKRTVDEGLLLAAQRAAFGVIEKDSKDSELFFVSSCPMGYRPAGDAKEFFLRAQLIHGTFDKTKCPQAIEDYMWLNPAEVAELLVGKNGDKDEVFYLKRMFGDDWWQDDLDSDELSPVEDALSMKPTKDIPNEEQKNRFQQEEQRRKQIKEKLQAASQATM